LGAKEQSNITSGSDAKSTGRLLALDLGAKRVGVAVCDELRLTVRPLDAIERRSWKDLLRRVAEHLENLEARGLVIGLPLNIDGSEGEAAKLAREVAEKFRLSIKLPVYLQDERLTTEEAKSQLRASGKALEIDQRVDSEAAAIILRDFMGRERS
jgi:putative holliday junction resolvase